jgi:hypothetical protein
MSAFFNQKNKYLRKVLLVAVLIVALTFPPFGRLFLTNANAALTSTKLQINNSQASATNVTYSFYFTTSATTAIKQIGIKFCTTPGAYGDSCTVPTGFNPGSPTLASDNLAGTGRTVTDPATLGERMRIVVGTPAAQSTQGVILTFTGVTNSSTINTTFYTRVTTYSDTGTTPIDYGQSVAAVLDTNSIAVTATVDPNLTFAVAGVSSAGTVNSATTNITTTASTIPFGTMAVGTPKIGATDVTVTTNAGSGYSVTASHSGILANAPLTSGSNTINSFSGTNTSPSIWSAPAGSTANTNTGYFGYTTESTSLCTGTAGRFSSNKWAGSSTTGQEVICSATGVSSQTTRLGWQAEVNAIQPAGGYTGTVILIATPTY